MTYAELNAIREKKYAEWEELKATKRAELKALNEECARAEEAERKPADQTIPPHTITVGK